MEQAIALIKRITTLFWNGAWCFISGCVFIVMLAFMIAVWDVSLEDIKEIFRK